MTAAIFIIIGFVLIILYAGIEQSIIFHKRHIVLPKEFTANRFKTPPSIGRTVEPDMKMKNIHSYKVYWGTQINKSIEKRQAINSSNK